MRLSVAFDLFEAGRDLMEQNLRRRYQDETAEQIHARLVDWLSTRPGATDGDCPGRTYELGDK